MSELLHTFRDRAADLLASINRQGGIKATIDGLRRQMAESDRRRAVRKVKVELKELSQQITEMITAVGVQAVGLHEANLLSSPELAPLCQHIVDLKRVLAENEAKLAQLEAEDQANTETPEDDVRCSSCGKGLPDNSTFCPYCGTRVPPSAALFCAGCGSVLREGARFCPQCGHSVSV